MKKFKAKKSLGQNFLKSESVVSDIVKVSDLNINDIVLEIGPGKGILTKFLLEKVKKVIAIEKDDSLISPLSKLFKKEIEEGKLVLIHDDVLTCNFEKLFDLKRYKIVANIPYYITGQLIRLFLSAKNKPISITLMLQKEVAERIVAKDGKESLLSLSVKAYGEPRYEFTVLKDEFTPSPKVDSAVLTIKNISSNFFRNDKEREKLFFSLIKQGFSSKRRKLANNLQNFYSEPKKLDHVFDRLGLNNNIRAERLTLNDWNGFLP